MDSAARVILVNRFFHPDESATSRMASSLALGLAERGWDVHALTSRQLYGAPDSGLPPRETVQAVTINRIWTSRFGRSHVLGRALDYVTFYASAFAWLIGRTKRGDILIAATDPPMLSVLTSLAAGITGAGRVNWLHDLYPEVATALGIPIPRTGLRLLQWLRNLSLCSATVNVVIGSRMADYVHRCGVPIERIALIHNWSDGRTIRPIEPEVNPLRREWGLEGRFVVGYSGNLGRGHDFDTVLRAARAMRDDPGITFLIIGAGHHLSAIESTARNWGLSNLVVKPYQPPDRLCESLGVADLHLVSLRPSLEGLMVPCKFYGVAAAGRPTLYIGDPDGEIPRVLREADCGDSISIGDADGLAACIAQLRRSPEQLARWKQNARAVLQQRFDREHAIDHWCKVLDSAAFDLSVAKYQAAGG